MQKDWIVTNVRIIIIVIIITNLSALKIVEFTKCMKQTPIKTIGIKLNEEMIQIIDESKCI